MTTSEKIALFKTVKSGLATSQPICVEIGSYLGASTCFIAAGLANDGKLYCIDTWENVHMKYDAADVDAGQRDTFSEFHQNTLDVKEKLILIRKWSTDAIHDLKKMESHIDFLFIDGDHSYEGCKMDWDNYFPLLKRGSVVVFHDTGWAEGVVQVVNEEVVSKSKLILNLPNMQAYQVQ